MELSDAYRRYWRSRERDLSVNTKNDYERTFERFRQFLAERDVLELEAVTTEDVEDYLNDLADQGLASKTVSNHWTALSSLWTWAEMKLKIPHIIHRHIKPPKVHNDHPKPYTRDEVEAMLRACKYNATWRGRPDVANRRPTELRDRAMLMILVDCGLRASELCDLQVQDYDPKIGQLRVLRGKGNKERIVPVGNRTADAIDDYLASRGVKPGQRRRRVSDKELAPDAPLFATATGKAVTRYELLNMVQACAARAGVANANLHRFRHTFAINYLRRHPNIYTLQRVLGHSSLDTVRLYLEISDVDVIEAHRSASVADNWRL